MPFGYDCEFPDFAACVSAQKAAGKDDEAARAICGALQRDTKEGCVRKKIEAQLEADERVEEESRDDEGNRIVKISRPRSTDYARKEIVRRKFTDDGDPLP